MKITSTGRTHVGMKRSHNEDCLKIYRDGNLLVVADGMGGHSSGEVASELSAETLISFYKSSALDDEMTWPYKYNYNQSYQENRMRIGIELSNYKVHSSSAQDPSLKGMGTTMVAICFYDDHFSVGHVGDSRVYRWRKGALTQITEDHSLLNDFIKMRPEGMSAKEIEAFPHKNIIVRALGMRETVQVDVISDKLDEGDVFLLCSDGLSGMINDEDMNQILSENFKKQLSLDLICERLIQEANKNGGTDNITVILAKVEPENSAETEDQNISPSWDHLPKEETPETRELPVEKIQEALQALPDLNLGEEKTVTEESLISVSELPTIKLMPSNENQPLKQPTPIPLSSADKTAIEEQKQETLNSDRDTEESKPDVLETKIVFDSMPNVDINAETMKLSASLHQQLFESPQVEDAKTLNTTDEVLDDDQKTLQVTPPSDELSTVKIMPK
jgi:serine/threonine protein phosphatase PrpC